MADGVYVVRAVIDVHTAIPDETLGFGVKICSSSYSAIGFPIHLFGIHIAADTG